MKKIAFLSMDSLDDFFVYDDLLIAPFGQVGYQVETVSWRNSEQDYSGYEAVIVRSPWDYQQAPQAFMACLEQIDSQTRLMNPLALMQWNVDKRYLRELASADVAVLPTLWLDDYHHETLVNAFEAFGCDEIVIKPCISANADDTFRLSRADLDLRQAQLAQVFSKRPAMVQPFVTSVVEQGEVSLFYFAGELSHAILKTPKQGDFRVQEEHGGTLAVITPEQAVIASAEQALSAMPTGYLYARVDLLQHQGKWCIIELELIEPSLYFNLDDTSPQKFVDAYLRYTEDK
ncbi:ATP-grasp domain-containing protein [Alteromonas sp. AMM-1]|uniref:ATP-grasp domain-containing protein n=1 Tax=Alteromonas sp. AMM-1 TaxID=3394233 RepID=UPI0039A544B6